MAEKISMADLLARSVAIEWFEAVSLVREVCSVLIAERVEESTPDLAQILLAASGKMTLTGTTHGDAPVRRLGQLLQAFLLRASDAPVTLRLVLSEAMAAPPVYASIGDLDTALAYFERPDRQAVLRSVYERATAAAPAAEDETPVSDLDAIVPLPAVQAQARKKPRKAANRRALALIAAGALVASGVAFMYQRGLLLRGRSLKVVGARATAAVDTAVLKTVSAVTEMAGMGKLVAAGTDVPEAPPALSTTANSKRRPPSTPITLAGVPVKLFDLQPAESDQPDVAPVAASAATLEASAEPIPAADTRVYGPDDHEVDAPIAVRPHLPTTLPQGVKASQLARLEVVVAPDGLVESVKLLPGTAAITVTEAMLVSAAKAWRFTPASRDGYPVRYRKTILLSDQ